jgi:hypothetical protein
MKAHDTNKKSIVLEHLATHKHSRLIDILLIDKFALLHLKNSSALKKRIAQICEHIMPSDLLIDCRYWT